MGMQGEVDDMRKKLTDEFGADSDQVKALNDVEARLLQAWSDNGGVVLGALMDASNRRIKSLFFTEAAGKAIGQMSAWT